MACGDRVQADVYKGLHCEGRNKWRNRETCSLENEDHVNCYLPSWHRGPRRAEYGSKQLEYVWLNVCSAKLSWTKSAETTSNNWLMSKYYKQRPTYKIIRSQEMSKTFKNNQIIYNYLPLDPFRCHLYVYISPISNASPSHSLQEVSLPRRPRWSHTHLLHRDPKWWSWPPSWIERPGVKRLLRDKLKCAVGGVKW